MCALRLRRSQLSLQIDGATVDAQLQLKALTIVNRLVQLHAQRLCADDRPPLRVGVSFEPHVIALPSLESPPLEPFGDVLPKQRDQTDRKRHLWARTREGPKKAGAGWGGEGDKGDGEGVGAKQLVVVAVLGGVTQDSGFERRGRRTPRSTARYEIGSSFAKS